MKKGTIWPPKFFQCGWRYLRLATYAAHENGTRWLVVHILHRVRRLAKDNGLNTKRVNNAHPRPDLTVNQRLRQ